MEKAPSCDHHSFGFQCHAQDRNDNLTGKLLSFALFAMEYENILFLL